MREKFHKYLKNKGFNETGITECISRIERGVPDQIDYFQLKGFKEDLRMENYELRAFIEKLQKKKNE